MISLARKMGKETSSEFALRSQSIVTRGKPYILRSEFFGLVEDDGKNENNSPLSTLTLWNMYRTKHDEIHIKTFLSDFCALEDE